MLEAFGDIVPMEREVEELVEDEKKNIHKKEKEPKYMTVTQKLVSYADFDRAISQLGMFDIQLGKLGYVKSPKLENEIKELTEKEEYRKIEREKAEAQEFDFGDFEELVSDLKEG